MQNVLDSLIPALLADKNRKFIYVEQVGQIPIFLIFFIAICLVAEKVDEKRAKGFESLALFLRKWHTEEHFLLFFRAIFGM